MIMSYLKLFIALGVTFQLNVLVFDSMLRHVKSLLVAKVDHPVHIAGLIGLH